MTDPHDRPYTFGWHGEVTRRDVSDRDYAEHAEDLCAGMLMAGGCDRHDHATMPAARDDRHVGPAINADVTGTWLAERDRAIAERAWDEGYEEGRDDMFPGSNPYRKADQ